jgi:hypothetical protein
MIIFLFRFEVTTFEKVSKPKIPHEFPLTTMLLTSPAHRILVELTEVKLKVAA